nr:uncharacterized protein CI109_000927 [Kwoniella shandongensis]KAA5530747.1 hypothetical protein CI109_000927 [Kwoniella shandongensis]
MPASTKQIIALSLLAGASAAPLNLFGTGHAGAAVNAVASADIQVIANALLNTATGGAVTATTALSAQLGATIGITRSLAVNAWATGQCVIAHADIAQCTQISAYLSAVHYAFEQGWTAAQLFAALGADRVRQFQTLLQSVCSHEPTGTCSSLLSAWPTYLAAMAQVDIHIATQAASQLTANGLITLIDAAHTGTALTAGLTTNLKAGVAAKGGSKLGLGLDVLGLHLRDVETEHGIERRLFGLENLFGHGQGQLNAGAATQAAVGAATNAAAAAAGGLNIANLVQAAGSLTAQTSAGAQAQAQGAVGGLLSSVPVVGGVVNKVTDTVGHLPVVGNVLPLVGGLTHNIPIVGGLTGQLGANTNANANANANANLLGSLNIPGLLSANGALSAATGAFAQVAGQTHGLLGRDLTHDILHSASGVLGSSASDLFHTAVDAHAPLSVGNGLDLDVAKLASEITEGELFAHEHQHELHQRALLSGLLSNPTGLLSSLPVVGNVGGILSNPTGALSSLPVGGILSNPTGLLNSLPIGNVGGILSNPTGLVNGLPVVGGVVNTLINTVNHLPIVGDVVHKVTDTLGHLPIVGGLAATASGAASSVTNAGLNLNQNGLNLGLNDITQLAGGLTEQGALNLKRGLLSGLPLLGSLPIGNVVDSLPLVNSLPVGSILSNPTGLLGNVLSNPTGLLNGLPVVGGVVNTVGHLPVVGDVVNKVTNTVGHLPLLGDVLGKVGGITGNVAATAQGQASSINNLGLGLGPNGLNAGLNSVTNAAGSLLGSGNLHIKKSLLSGLPLVGSLPIVNSLPIVGSGSGLGSAANGLPIVGQALPAVNNILSGLTSKLPIVNGLKTNNLPIVGGLINNLPVVGGLVNGLTHNLPIIGGNVGAAAQGSASSINNLGLGLGQNGLNAGLNSITNVAGSLLGSGSLNLTKKSLLAGLPLNNLGLPVVNVNDVINHLPLVNNLGLISTVSDATKIQLGPIEAQLHGLVHTTQNGLQGALAAGLKVGDLITAHGQGIIGATL